MKLTLCYPLSPVRLNQGFGVNGEYYRANDIDVQGHNGIDLGAYHGQPVYAAHAGMAYYEKDDDAGEGVVIITDQSFDYKNGSAYFKTIYWHLCNPVAEPKYASPIFLAANKKWNSGVGVHVRTGDLIGYADNTGLSNGDHTHFGLKPIMPGFPPTYGDSPDVGIGQWINVEPNNGYLGAIDPTPFFNGIFAPNINVAISLIQKLILLLQKQILLNK